MTMQHSFPFRDGPLAQLVQVALDEAQVPLTVEKLEAAQVTSSPMPKAYFHAHLSDGQILALHHSPNPTLRLMRSEKKSVKSEALAIAWLSRSDVLPSPERGYEPDFDATTKGSFNMDKGALTYILGGPSHNQGDKTMDQNRRSASDGSCQRLPTLLGHNFFGTAEDTGTPALVMGLTPELRESSDFTFVLYEPLPGSPLLFQPLSPSERRHADLGKGRLVRHLAEFRSPDNRFGPAVDVLPAELLNNAPMRVPRVAQTAAKSFHPVQSQSSFPPSPTPPLSPSEPTFGDVGDKTMSWRAAFHAMLEAALRDAEDMAITLSYSLIRGHFQRLSPALDKVTAARMVILDSGEDGNVLVSRSSVSCGPFSRLRTREADCPPLLQNDQMRISRQKYNHYNNATIDDASLGDNKRKRKWQEETKHEKDNGIIRVTGLSDWGNCIFGDPLMTSIFSSGEESVPEAFLRGFARGEREEKEEWESEEEFGDKDQGNCSEQQWSSHLQSEELAHFSDDGTSPAPYEEVMIVKESQPPLPPRSKRKAVRRNPFLGRLGKDDKEKSAGDTDEIIQDPESVPLRLLLYECYHAIVAVVRQVYRPQAPSQTARGGRDVEVEARRRLAGVLRRMDLAGR